METIEETILKEENEISVIMSFLIIMILLLVFSWIGINVIWG